MKEPMSIGMIFFQVVLYIFSDAMDVSKRLETSLDQLAPLLRDIFLDYSSYLTKVLVGSHGQELLNEGLSFLDNLWL